MTFKPIVILGRHGQLARAMMQLCAAEDLSCMALGREELDLCNEAAVRETLLRIAPEIVVNAAAYTAVDRAESEPESAFALNARAPELLAAICQELDAALVHVSTDYVLAGQGSAPQSETAPLGPCNAYGQSKLDGEQAVQASGAKAVILRTSWVIGPDGPNFVATMLRLARDEKRQGTALNVVDDQRGCPTLVDDLAMACLMMARQLQKTDAVCPPVVNFSNAGAVSWAGLARATMETARDLGLPSLDINPIPSSDYPTPAKRPTNSVLDTSLYQQLTGHGPRHWRDGLRDIVVSLNAQLENG